MIEFVDVTFKHLAFIAQNLRERDRLELSATVYDIAESVESLTAVPGYKKTVLLDGVPVFVGGLVPCGPGSARGWGFGTDDAAKAMLSITKHARMAIKAVVGTGVKRIDAVCRVDVAPIGWLCSLGMTRTSSIGQMNGAPMAVQWGMYG